jgi:cytochrome c oxidase subunit 3/cytochrome o ubiquinol oxidase subunit 3
MQGLNPFKRRGIEVGEGVKMTDAQVSSHEDHFRAGKVMGLSHRKLGMWLFVATEVMFFGGLLAAFLHYKVRNPSPSESALLDVTLVGINTFLLLTSSFTVVLGLAAIQNDNVGALKRYFGLTILLGVAFLAGQGFEFFNLFNEGMTLRSSVFGSSFFTLTGFHGLHVLIGVVWAGIILLNSFRGRFSSEKYEGVEVFGLYWHFVDIVWIILFTLIYLT